MSEAALPPRFAALEPFLANWRGATVAERAGRRNESSDADRRAFYDAAKDLVAPALDSLAGTSIGELSPSERRLLDLMLAWAHVALAVEIQAEWEPRHAALRLLTPLSPAAN